MTKQDIVRAISERLDLPKAKAQEAVQTTFDALINALVKEGRVELRNFGVFQIKRRDGRVARNPRTGDVVNVPPRYFCKFQAGQGNGSTGKETRRAPVSLEFVFYREALLLTDTYLFQQNACCFEKFYHRTARSCSVNSCSVNRNSMQRKTHKESSRWSADNHRDVPAQSRTKDNYLCEELTYSTETNDITDTGSAAR